MAISSEEWDELLNNNGKLIKELGCSFLHLDFLDTDDDVITAILAYGRKFPDAVVVLPFGGK